jgi:hypothetical protein
MGTNGSTGKPSLCDFDIEKLGGLHAKFNKLFDSIVDSYESFFNVAD